MNTGATIEKNVLIYDGWNLIGEMNVSGSLIREYVWGLDLSDTEHGAGGVGGLLMVKDSSGSYYAGYDGNGNVVALVDSSDGSVDAVYEYDAFGNALRTTGPMADANPFRFSTKYFENEVGLAYYGYRYYSPGLGRWLNRDPIGEDGGASLYLALNNSLVDGYDYLGLEGPGKGTGLWLKGTTEDGVYLHAKFLDEYPNGIEFHKGAPNLFEVADEVGGKKVEVDIGEFDPNPNGHRRDVRKAKRLANEQFPGWKSKGLSWHWHHFETPDGRNVMQYVPERFNKGIHHAGPRGRLARQFGRAILRKSAGLGGAVTLLGLVVDEASGENDRRQKELALALNAYVNGDQTADLRIALLACEISGSQIFFLATWNALQ